MMEITFQSATHLAKAIQDKRISSVELLEYYIERVERLNPLINAVVATDFNNARVRARQADDALAKGEDWGPLHGLPITIKDSIEVSGMPCTWGAPIYKDYTPEKNAEVVQPLLDAGAVIFGKTNLPIFAMDVQSFNEVYGQTNNPWDVTRTPGGSSGGSAAAVSAGLTGLEIGSDIGGSIRSPAHFCGIYGHKPTFGIASMHGQIPAPGMFPGDYSLEPDIAVTGPLARSAEDLDLVMDLIVKPAIPERKAMSIKLPGPRKKTIKEYRIGLWMDDPVYRVDTEVGDCLQATVDKLAKAGVLIEEKRPDIDFIRCYQVYTDLLNLATVGSLPQPLFESLGAEGKNLKEDDQSQKAIFIRGVTKLHRDWQMLNYERLIMRQKWADFFKDFDLLLCPTVRVAAFSHDHTQIIDRVTRVNNKDESCIDAVVPWAGLTCVAYLPATIAPVGFTPKGLPVGMQIVGPYLEDRTSIHFAKLIEDITGGFTSPSGFE